MNTTIRDLDSDSEELEALEQDLQSLSDVKRAIGEAVVGQQVAIEQLLVCMISGGHALIEGAPGLGKTLLVKTISDVLGLEYSRIQFTPDLMPADITGTLTLLHEDGRGVTRFQPGPIFAHLVLADEINRATPKTQSALLEAMQEETVTVAGVAHRLHEPFLVMATQNPYEMDGTYSLPEAQIDRFFFKIDIDYPTENTLVEILDLTTGPGGTAVRRVMAPSDLVRVQSRVREVPIARDVKLIIARFVHATLPNVDTNSATVRKYVRFGISPRGAQALVLASKARALLSGHYHVSIDDVRAAVIPALRHRMQLNYHGIADSIPVGNLLSDLFESEVRASAR